MPWGAPGTEDLPDRRPRRVRKPRYARSKSPRRVMLADPVSDRRGVRPRSSVLAQGHSARSSVNAPRCRIAQPPVKTNPPRRGDPCGRSCSCRAPAADVDTGGDKPRPYGTEQPHLFPARPRPDPGVEVGVAGPAMGRTHRCLFSSLGFEPWVRALGGAPISRSPPRSTPRSTRPHSPLSFFEHARIV